MLNGTPVPSTAHSAPPPGELMGLAGLLRAWREAAGRKKGLQRQLTQDEVADAIQRSVRWYRSLESGATPRLERQTLDALSEVLALERDERQALHLYALGGSLPAASPPHVDSPALRDLLLLVDQVMPSPAYLCDANWNIVGYNAAMTEWWPWVSAPQANLMRWALLSAESRQQYVDWPRHAAEYLALLRFAAFERPHDHQLAELLNEIRNDPDCRRIWESGNEVAESRDSHHYWLSLPRNGFDTIEVVSHVLHPGSLPGCRLVVVTWLQDIETPQSDPEARS
ncbi:helix-turn-helix domain-containing protein [Streptomyces sp. SID5785]|uniref:helix-turn-helix transcriptional regulator n=1 Tax=Streptomyces sp. SID5785 TaxID=2690309 RepID=UPI0013613E7C|nr:helix-turn-helix transcriptional regulator [Streptomyces sp. SID5785]MZD10403.1 helix-turn-helix domain-containing protein [Streptomyces sp. SID5785]